MVTAEVRPLPDWRSEVVDSWVPAFAGTTPVVGKGGAGVFHGVIPAVAEMTKWMGMGRW